MPSCQSANPRATFPTAVLFLRFGNLSAAQRHNLTLCGLYETKSGDRLGHSWSCHNMRAPRRLSSGGPIIHDFVNVTRSGFSGAGSSFDPRSATRRAFSHSRASAHN